MKPFTSTMFLLALIIGALFSASQGHAQSIGDSIHAVHYDIHIRNVNTANNTITAFTEIKIKSRVNDLSYIRLQLRDLDIDTLWLDNNPTTNYQYDYEFIKVLLPDPIQEGDSILVGVAYNGEPYHESWGGPHCQRSG